MGTTRTGQHERGQVTTAVVTTLALLMLAMGLGMALRLSAAADDAGEIRTSADAAALAGAQEIRRQAPRLLAEALAGRAEVPCGVGMDAAADFARRNDSTLVSYCYFPLADRIEVRVRSNQVTESGRREETTAVARLGKRLGPCRLPDRPEPEPTPPQPSPTSGTTAPTPSPTTSTSPPDETVTARCGDIEVPVVLPGDGGELRVDLDAGRLADLLEPALAD